MTASKIKTDNLFNIMIKERYEMHDDDDDDESLM